MYDGPDTGYSLTDDRVDEPAQVFDSLCAARPTITEAEVDADSFPLSDMDVCVRCGGPIVEADYGARVWYHLVGGQG